MTTKAFTLAVPTKTSPDGDGSWRATDRDDAFSRYSDDARRLAVLLGREEEADGATGREEDVAAAAAGATAGAKRGREGGARAPPPGPRRRTRITFEVHPALLLADLLGRDDGERA